MATWIVTVVTIATSTHQLVDFKQGELGHTIQGLDYPLGMPPHDVGPLVRPLHNPSFIHTCICQSHTVYTYRDFFRRPTYVVEWVEVWYLANGYHGCMKEDMRMIYDMGPFFGRIQGVSFR